MNLEFLMIEAKVKCNLCNVSETNDADLNSRFLDLVLCSAAPTTRAFNRLLSSGHGEMDQLLTLGNVPVNSKTAYPPPGNPRAYDSR